MQADFTQTMEARAAEVVELRKADKDTTARRAHCTAVVKKQEEQLQVGLNGSSVLNRGGLLQWQASIVSLLAVLALSVDVLVGTAVRSRGCRGLLLRLLRPLLLLSLVV